MAESSLGRRFEGRGTLVTGAASGIGRATVYRKIERYGLKS